MSGRAEAAAASTCSARCRGSTTSRPSAGRAAGRGAGHDDAVHVHEEAMTAGANVRVQRLRALVRRHGRSSSCCSRRPTSASRCCSSASAACGAGCAARRCRGWRCSAERRVSGTIISLMMLLVSFGFAMIVFGVRIQGSVAGFVGVSIACALMASTFGLLVAALGRTPAADARRHDAGGADDGDARRRVGADVHLPGAGCSGSRSSCRCAGPWTGSTR